MDTPILNGPPGFILLAIVVALGAYLRTVAGAADETYEKTKASWPPGQPYTEDRLKNLDNVYTQLKNLTWHIFVFTVVLTVRLALSAVWVIPGVRSKTFDWMLYVWDLLTMIALIVGFVLMWYTHLVTSDEDRRCVNAMRNARAA